MSDLGGVWRTVGGRRIFIKDGEDLATAMKNSGKFGNKEEPKGFENSKIRIVDKNDPYEKFYLIQNDCFMINLHVDDLLKLKVNYVFTINDLEKFNNEEATFNKIYEFNKIKIYEIRTISLEDGSYFINKFIIS